MDNTVENTSRHKDNGLDVSRICDVWDKTYLNHLQRLVYQWIENSENEND